jgi:chromosome segregation ATPase
MITARIAWKKLTLMMNTISIVERMRYKMSNPFNVKYDEEYEYVQLPKELYDKVIESKSRQEQEKMFFAEIEARKMDVKSEIENLEDDVLRFKAVGIRYKNSLEKIYEEQAVELDKLWEGMNLEDNIYSKLKTMNSQLSEFKNDVKQINESMNRLNAYNLEKIITLVERFNNFTSEDKEIIKYLTEKKGV